MIRRVVLPAPGEEVKRAVNRVLDSGRYVNGPETIAFEEAWADYCGAKYCVGMGSGTQALVTAFRALGIERGDSVLCPALSFVATAKAIVTAGGTPVYCDVDSRGLMDPDCAIRAPICKFVLPVHLYGQLVDLKWMRGLMGAIFIEDACQAHGQVRTVKSDAACFSFYPTKNLGALGMAGAIVTNDEDVYEKAKENAIMDEIQAAVLLAKLPGLDEANEMRKEVAQWYREFGVESFVEEGNYYLYPVLADDPERVKQVMWDAGVEVGIHYPYILPDRVPSGMIKLYTQALTLAFWHVTLPMYPELDRATVKHISEEFHRCVAL